jgi:hypothetical protein
MCGSAQVDKWVRLAQVAQGHQTLSAEHIPEIIRKPLIAVCPKPRCFILGVIRPSISSLLTERSATIP